MTTGDWVVIGLGALFGLPVLAGVILSFLGLPEDPDDPC